MVAGSGIPFTFEQYLGLSAEQKNALASEVNKSRKR